MAHPFRFCVTAGAVHDPTALAEVARRAEDLGYDALTMPDHLDDQLAPLLALAHAASVTTRLRIGTLVLANDYRHPAVLAKELATLDQLSSGRLEIGIGAGWMRTDYESAGLPFDRPGVRIERLAEAVAVLKALLSGGPVDHDGSHYSIHGLQGAPPCVQLPHPPFLLAGGGHRMLALAAREADVVGLNPSLAAGVIDERAGASATPAATDAKLATIREAAGERFDGLEVQTRVHVTMVTPDREAVARSLAPALGVAPDEALGSPHALVGTVDQLVEDLIRRRDRWGINVIAVAAASMEELAPVVERLAGR